MTRPGALATILSTMLCIATTAPDHALAQNTAALNVILIDDANRPMADALVELSATPSSASGSKKAAAATITLPCNSRGECAETELPPGRYAVTIRSASVNAMLTDAIELAAGKTLRLIIRVAGTTAAAIVSLGTIRITPTGMLSTGSAPSVELNPQTLAQRGAQNLAQSLALQSGVTLNRPNGSAPSLPVSIILRGSDPKETIVQIDGHPINNSNTGDFDVSLLDPSAFSTVQVLYGLSPASLIGANTEGGTVNFHTLEPTRTPHGLVRYTFGSFATHGYTVATTGSANRLGYAVELHSYNQQGEVAAYPVIDAATGQRATLGSGSTGNSALVKFRYTVGLDGMFEASVLALGSQHNLSAALSTPVNPSAASPGAPFTSYAGSDRNNLNTFYDGDIRLPLGPRENRGEPPAFVTVRHMTSFGRQNVNGLASGLTEYLLNDADLINDNSVEYERLLPDADLALVAQFESERLTTPEQFGAASPTQTQNSRYFLARYLWSGGSRLQYVASAYYSHFSTSGTSISPRAGVVWTPNVHTVMRASIGSGFQAPLLTEKIISSPLPPPDADGLINIGNPALKADYTTEYELDGEQVLGNGAGAATGELDLYRVNQRDDDLTFIPGGASPSSPKLSYPVNITNSVWQGAALKLNLPLDDGLSTAMSYNINQTYPLALPAALNASAGNLVPFQQFQNIPMHRATLSLQQQARALYWTIEMAYEGVNNDLNEPPFGLVNANVTYTFSHTDVALSANNLTALYARKFTLAGVGVPYAGLTGPIPTDAYPLQAPSLSMTLTQRW